LLNLDEELDLADSAAAALQVIAWADLSVLRKMIANTRRNLAHLIDDAEIQRPAPDERLDRLEEAFSHRSIPGAGAGTDERCTLPRQRARFVMRDRGMDGQCNRRDFGRRAQAEIDALHITVGSAL